MLGLEEQLVRRQVLNHFPIQTTKDFGQLRFLLRLHFLVLQGLQVQLVLVLELKELLVVWLVLKSRLIQTTKGFVLLLFLFK